MTESEPGRARIAEIADLLAWARRLTETGRPTDLTERAAYLAAKAELLARNADTPAAEHPCHRDMVRDIAAQAAAWPTRPPHPYPPPTRTSNDR